MFHTAVVSRNVSLWAVCRHKQHIFSFHSQEDLQASLLLTALKRTSWLLFLEYKVSDLMFYWASGNNCPDVLCSLLRNGGKKNRLMFCSWGNMWRISSFSLFTTQTSALRAPQIYLQMYLVLDLTSVNVSLKRNWASQKLHVPLVSSGMISVLFLDVLFRQSSSSFAQLWCVIPSELEWRRVKTFHRCLFHPIHLDSSKSLETLRSDGALTCGLKTTTKLQEAVITTFSEGWSIWDLIREDY